MAVECFDSNTTKLTLSIHVNCMHNSANRQRFAIQSTYNIINRQWQNAALLIPNINAPNEVQKVSPFYILIRSQHSLLWTAASSECLTQSI